MISSNIDLTEHRDFSNHAMVFFEIPTGVYLDEELSTPEIYEIIKRYEKFFGRTRHRDEAYKIVKSRKNLFLDDEAPIIRCDKCGRKTNIPWIIDSVFCRGCMQSSPDIFPWAIRKPMIRRLGDRGQGDLFDLR